MARKTAKKAARKPTPPSGKKAGKKTGKKKVSTKKSTAKPAKKTATKKTLPKSKAQQSKGQAKTGRPKSEKSAKSSASGKAGRTATAAEIGADLVALCNLGRSDEVVGKWYHQRLVSVEGDGMTTTGLKALARKYAWWDENHEIHALTASGPFVGHTGFAVRFDITVTPKGDQRTDMSEIAVYTVRDGRIVREEFMYGG